MDHIFCLVGPSGSGKTTIARALHNKGYNVIQSYTTRPPREANEWGHIFVGDLPDSANIIAYNKFNGFEYWATREQVKGETVYVIDPSGAEMLRKTVDIPVTVIFLWLPWQVAFSRMAIDRGRKRADHYVTRVMPCPTVLIEYLFISNPREAEFAKDSKRLASMGQATAEGIAKALDLPRKEVAPESWPTHPIPKIQRTVGVEVDGKRTDIIGYLINNRTYLPMLEVGRIAGVEVTGHGDYIKIKT